MTPRQHDLLRFIERYTAEHDGVAPSFEEMRAAIGNGSKSSVHRLIVTLHRDGLMSKGGRVRGWRVVPRPSALANFSTEQLLGELAARGVPAPGAPAAACCCDSCTLTRFAEAA